MPELKQNSSLEMIYECFDKIAPKLALFVLRVNTTVKFSFSSISPFTTPFVTGIMGRKEGYYSLSPEHMLKSCTNTPKHTHTR